MPVTREKLKLAPDVPYTLTLDVLEAPEANSQYSGLEYRFSFTYQGRPVFVYLPRAARDLVFKTRVQPGEDLEIVKTMHGREAAYSVQILSDAAEPAPHNGHSTARDFSEQLARESSERRAWAQPKPNGNGSNVQPINGNGHPESHPMVDLMTKCIVYGARANQAAYEQLRQAGIELDAPTWEDARATGSSLFIERNKQVRS